MNPGNRPAAMVPIAAGVHCPGEMRGLQKTSSGRFYFFLTGGERHGYRYLLFYV